MLKRRAGLLPLAIGQLLLFFGWLAHDAYLNRGALAGDFREAWFFWTASVVPGTATPESPYPRDLAVALVVVFVGCAAAEILLRLPRVTVVMSLLLACGPTDSLMRTSGPTIFFFIAVLGMSALPWFHRLRVRSRKSAENRAAEQADAADGRRDG